MFMFTLLLTFRSGFGLIFSTACKVQSLVGGRDQEARRLVAEEVLLICFDNYCQCE